MKEKLNNIRKPDYSLSLKRKIINTLLIFIFGILLGIFSKWVDNLVIDDSIAWQHFIGSIDLRNILSEMTIWIFIALNLSIFSKTPLRAALNVFLFFLGMVIAYHLYTIMFSGFNPRNYMMIWYITTLLSPIFAYICWYAKSKHVVSIIISSLIIAILIPICFNIGSWYFELNRFIYLIMFVAIIITLYVSPKNTIISLIIGFILSFIIPNINTVIYSLL
jgi:hypothetical protein